MKTLPLVALFILLSLLSPSMAQTVADSQKQAVTKYPALSREGTPIHTKFLSLVTEMKEQNPAFFNAPSWPMTLADRAASAIKAEADAAAKKAAQVKAEADAAVKQAAQEALWKNVHTIREVGTDQLNFLDKPVAVNGSIDVSSYYNFGYLDAEPTHYSFELQSEAGSCHLYMERAKAADLRKQVVEAGGSLKGSFLVVVLKSRYEGNSLDFEILDYRPSPK